MTWSTLRILMISDEFISRIERWSRGLRTWGDPIESQRESWGKGRKEAGESEQPEGKTGQPIELNRKFDEEIGAV